MFAESVVLPQSQLPLRSAFRRGFLAMMPLWLGTIPFAIAFAMLARTAGIGAWETQAFSLFVFAGSSQVAAVTLAAADTPLAITIIAAALLNLRHILYGLSIGQRLEEPRTENREAPGTAPIAEAQNPDLHTTQSREWKLPRWLLAFLLTDEAYGMTIGSGLQGRAAAAFLFGAGISLYLSFNLATLVGILLGGFLPNPGASGLDVIFPLTFVALLVPLIQTRRDLPVVVAAGIAGPLLALLMPGGIAILLAALLGIGVGVALDALRPDHLQINAD